MARPATRFERPITVHVPKAMHEAVDEAASQQLVTRAQYARTALLDRLRKDGVPIASEVA